MRLSDIPARFPIPFANNAAGAYIRAIPTPHQTPTTGDAPASLYDGFPPETFTDPDAGGVPPSGRDMNGILNRATAWLRWVNAGSPAVYDAVFQTAIGGYPNGSIVMSSSTPGLFWASLVDNNSSNPDASGANWAVAFDSIIAQSLIVNNGYRVYASGFKECWGRVDVPGSGSVRVPMPYTHTDFIVPNYGPQATGVNQISLDPPEVSAFTLHNASATTSTVNWSTRGV